MPVYAGADWHEREAWEMFGVDFVGPPRPDATCTCRATSKVTPLRKDFPLLARRVKPWPGIVDVEPMPGERRRGATRATADEGGSNDVDHLRSRPAGGLLAAQAADDRINVDYESEGMTLNIGPQHPATHGTLRIVAASTASRWCRPSPSPATCTAATRS